MKNVVDDLQDIVDKFEASLIKDKENLAKLENMLGRMKLIKEDLDDPDISPEQITTHINELTGYLMTVVSL